MERKLRKLCHDVRRTHRPRAKDIIPWTFHALLQPDHVHRDLQDRSEQGERAAPLGAQCRAAINYLADQMLDAPAVVLHRSVECLLPRRELRPKEGALPLGDDLRLADVCLVPKAVLPRLDVALQEAIPLKDARVMPDPNVWACVL